MPHFCTTVLLFCTCLLKSQVKSLNARVPQITSNPKLPKCGEIVQLNCTDDPMSTSSGTTPSHMRFEFSYTTSSGGLAFDVPTDANGTHFETIDKAKFRAITKYSASGNGYISMEFTLTAQNYDHYYCRAALGEAAFSTDVSDYNTAEGRLNTPTGGSVPDPVSYITGNEEINKCKEAELPYMTPANTLPPGIIPTDNITEYVTPTLGQPLTMTCYRRSQSTDWTASHMQFYKNTGDPDQDEHIPPEFGPVNKYGNITHSISALSKRDNGLWTCRAALKRSGEKDVLSQYYGIYLNVGVDTYSSPCIPDESICEATLVCRLDNQHGNHGNQRHVCLCTERGYKKYWNGSRCIETPLTSTTPATPAVPLVADFSFLVASIVILVALVASCLLLGYWWFRGNKKTDDPKVLVDLQPAGDDTRLNKQ